MVRIQCICSVTLTVLLSVEGRACFTSEKCNVTDGIRSRYLLPPSPKQTASTDQQEDYDNLTTMPIKYHTVGLTSGRCRSSQELSEIGTPCHLTKPAWTHLKLLKLQSVSNKLPRLLLSFNLF